MNCHPRCLGWQANLLIIFGASIGDVFMAKMPATVTHDCHHCSCLGHLGRCNTDRTISICITSPKVAKASKEGNITYNIVDIFAYKLRQCTRALVGLETHLFYLIYGWVVIATYVCGGWFDHGILKGEVSLYH